MAPDDAYDDVIDGNFSGEVEIGDIFPLADNFFREVAGYSIVEADSQIGSYSKIDEVLPSKGIANGRLHFEKPLPLTPGWWVSVTPVDRDGSPGIQSNAIEVSVPPANQPPIESLSVNPTSDDAPLTVNFYESASTDADGTIALYK